jgi:hypothetical protein
LKKISKQIAKMDIVNSVLLNGNTLQINTNLVNHMSDQIVIFIVKQNNELVIVDDGSISFELSLLDNFTNTLFENFKIELDPNVFSINNEMNEVGMLIKDNVIESVSFFVYFLENSFSSFKK